LRQAGIRLGGADRVALLEAIAQTGSMTRAAQRVGISYKTAWDRVHGMNNVSREPLVVRSVGGAGGGGTTLTPYAQALVAAFRQLERDHDEVVGRLAKNLAAPRDLLRSLSTLGLRTSARNQLVGSVVAVQRGAVNAAVQMRLPGGRDSIHATLTLASLKELAIRRGSEVVALIKAPSVMLALAGDAPRLSVRNVLAGRVSAVRVGAVNTEVQVLLGGGQTMVAMPSRDAAQRLALAEGTAVSVIFQESSVILGVV
jgi:molybdate transport system regulatory protein